MLPKIIGTLLLVLLGTAASSAAAAPAHGERAAGLPEARLVQVYKLIALGDTRQALVGAQALVRDFPTFQLAQLVYGDLLLAQTRTLRRVGDVPDELASSSAETLRDLREEAELRLAGFKHRPPVDSVPAQFLSLSPINRHAIAVDVSRARLYLFENRTEGVRLVADYYISVGKAGVGKLVEGDKRTPLGVYFVTSNLDARRLADLYGAGALPINYPNAYDVRRGRGGGGIWLHGTPSAQYARAPRATDGCVAVANPDLERILRTVQIRTTPVVIAQQISWVSAHSHAAEKASMHKQLQAWAKAKATGDRATLSDFYAPDFHADGRGLSAHQARLHTEVEQLRGRSLDLKDISMLGWSEGADVRVLTFAEVPAGARAGRQVRQYWERRGAAWKIVYETELK